jgi:transcription initiation factor IIE alpha subunit
MDDSGHSRLSKNAETVGYTCPMHPEIRSPSPGTCPKCGMKLVPTKTKQNETTHHEHEMQMIKND